MYIIFTYYYISTYIQTKTKGLDVRNNFGKDAVFVSRQYVKPFLQERLAIRRVLLQDQEALAKAKAGRPVEIIEFEIVEVSNRGNQLTSFDLEFRFGIFPLVSPGWDWPSQQPLWPSTHCALSRCTDLLTRWIRESLLHDLCLVRRELRSYKKFHISVFSLALSNIF